MKQRQYNLDKTAYDLEKENKRFIWKFFTYLYFLLFSLRNFKEIYIMCGIIGFTGNLQAPGILVDGLQQLEYRGYDSAGIAVNNGSETKIVKTTGKVATLREKVEATADLAGTCGIGHTRWATHGGATENNAHPHMTDRVAVVHNGIIENYKELKNELQKKGYLFESETDTEVLVQLIEYIKTTDKTDLQTADNKWASFTCSHHFIGIISI
jgi:glucosamine--fructose-6-phosphate aminotransferase (isomerizing)